MRNRAFITILGLTLPAALVSCESHPLGSTEIEDARFVASVQGDLALEYEGRGFFHAFTPPAGVPRPASFTILSSELGPRARQRQINSFQLQLLGAERPEVGRYPLEFQAGESSFGATYLRMDGQLSAVYSARSGEVEITLSTPERIEGTFHFSGVRTCTGTVNMISCSSLEMQEALQNDGPSIEVTGSFVARVAPRQVMWLR